MRTTKIRFITLTLALIASGSIYCTAIHADKQVPKVLITLQKVGTKMKPLRLKAPDRQVVTCAYDGEEMYLSFAIPEGMATLSVTDESLLSSTFEIDTTPLEVTVPVGELCGTVTIEMETDSDHHYYGVM